MATDNLNITQPTASQADKITTINDALNSLDNATQGQVDVSVAAGNVTLTDAQTRNFRIRATGAPGTNRTVTFPNRNRFALVENATTGGFTVTFDRSGGGTTVILGMGERALIHISDAGDVSKVSPGFQLLQTLQFGKSAVAATNEFLTVSGAQTSGTIGFEMTRAGSVIGIGVNLTTAETAPGTINVQVMVNNSAVFAVQLTSAGSGLYVGTATQAAGIDALVAGDTVSLRMNYGTYTGTLANVVVHVECLVTV